MCKGVCAHTLFMHVYVRERERDHVNASKREGNQEKAEWKPNVESTPEMRKEEKVKTV